MPFKPSEMFIRALDDAEVRPDSANARMVNDPNVNPASRLGALIDLSMAERAKSKWGMHVEVVTNIVPSMNDDDEQLEGLAAWIRDRLGELTPWHVTRFYPQHEMLYLPPTPVAKLERAYDIGKAAGLKFVYTGNVPGHDGENTVCYSCGNKLIGRVGYNISIAGLENSRCGFCGAELNVTNGGGAA